MKIGVAGGPVRWVTLGGDRLLTWFAGDAVEGSSDAEHLAQPGDVIVHIFRPEVREFYQLEKMWLQSGETTDPS